MNGYGLSVDPNPLTPLNARVNPHCETVFPLESERGREGERGRERE